MSRLDLIEKTHGAVRRLALIIVMNTVFLSLSHGAPTLEELRNTDMLRATVSVDSEEELYQRAPFILVVEVATPRWFSRGTRVREFRIPSTVVRPVSNFADNSSQRINGETWSVQRWRFRVFPQEEGTLRIPPLEVFASVNTEADGAVEGELTLEPLSVQIRRPPGADNEDVWIATPSLVIEESWEGRLDSYIPGDAITRSRRFVVQDAPGMMLEASEIEDIPGLSLYEAPPRVADQSDRGKLLGTREETLVVTFESPGVYRLPGLEYAWFNTRSGEFETLSLPPIELEVIASTPQGANQEETAPLSFSKPVIYATITALILLLLLWVTPETSLSRSVRARINKRQRGRQQYRNYLEALGQENSARCVQLLFEQHTQGKSRHSLKDVVGAESTAPGAPAPQNQRKTGSSLQLLLEHAYGKGSELPDRDAAVELWKAVTHPERDVDSSSGLHLNPLSSTS